MWASARMNRLSILCQGCFFYTLSVLVSFLRFGPFYLLRRSGWFSDSGEHIFVSGLQESGLLPIFVK